MRRLLLDLRKAVSLLGQPRAVLAAFRHAGPTIRQSVALFREFLEGGVVVPPAKAGGAWPAPPAGVTRETLSDRLPPSDHGEVDLYSVIQLDGDLALKVSGRFRSRPAASQKAEIDAHIAEMRQRLAPMGELRDLLIGAAAMSGLVVATGGTVGSIVSGFMQSGWVTVLLWLAPGAFGVLLSATSRPILGFVVGSLVKRRLERSMADL